MHYRFSYALRIDYAHAEMSSPRWPPTLRGARQGKSPGMEHVVSRLLGCCMELEATTMCVYVRIISNTPAALSALSTCFGKTQQTSDSIMWLYRSLGEPGSFMIRVSSCRGQALDLSLYTNRLLSTGPTRFEYISMTDTRTIAAEFRVFSLIAMA